MLIYIHLVFARHPVQCLEGIKDTWPRDGILRVEVMKGSSQQPYSIDQSYEKERRLQLRARQQQDELSMIFGGFTSDG